MATHAPEVNLDAEDVSANVPTDGTEQPGKKARRRQKQKENRKQNNPEKNAALSGCDGEIDDGSGLRVDPRPSSGAESVGADSRERVLPSKNARRRQRKKKGPDGAEGPHGGEVGDLQDEPGEALCVADTSAPRDTRTTAQGGQSRHGPSSQPPNKPDVRPKRKLTKREWKKRKMKEEAKKRWLSQEGAGEPDFKLTDSDYEKEDLSGKPGAKCRQKRYESAVKRREEAAQSVADTLAQLQAEAGIVCPDLPDEGNQKKDQEQKKQKQKKKSQTQDNPGNVQKQRQAVDGNKETSATEPSNKLKPKPAKQKSGDDSGRSPRTKSPGRTQQPRSNNAYTEFKQRQTNKSPAAYFYQKEAKQRKQHQHQQGYNAQYGPNMGPAMNQQSERLQGQNIHQGQHLRHGQNDGPSWQQRRDFMYQVGQGGGVIPPDVQGLLPTPMVAPQGTPMGDGKKKRAERNRQRQYFQPYWSKEDVQSGLKKGELIEGPIRINQKNYEDAYVPHPDGKSDVYVSGMKDRNRALNGDIVVIVINPRDKWKVYMDDLNSMKEKDLAKQFSKCSLSDPVEDAESEEDSSSSASDAQSSDEDVIIEEVYYEHSADAEDNKAESQVCDSKSAKDNSKKSGSQAPGTPQAKQNKQQHKKRFTTLGDLTSAQDGVTMSRGVKKLFQDGGASSQTEDEQRAAAERKMAAVPGNMLLRTGRVVYISEKKHSRACMGHLRLFPDKNPNQALFAPMDSRVVRIMVPMADCPQGFFERPEDFAKTLIICRITEWAEHSQYAKGAIARSIGEAGEIEPETEGILIEYDIDYSEFSEEALACLPQTLPWRIPESEFSYRRDLRRDCIFTIDPATARDLDDALSCKPLGNGRFEIGVHIADVSFFVQPDNALDEVAAARATSVYMVQRVIPMLPRLLCEQLCSLNPDEDRLTFSVIWTVNENGQIEAEWFGRTVIRSCVKLSYDHAQGFIEEPERAWTREELPPISEGFTIPQIKEIVLQLHKIAQVLRQRRHDDGALRLDQTKLAFSLDKDTGMPNGYSVYRQRDSNKLVEEFMLLANMAVARQIYGHNPEISVLRRHPPPQARMIDELMSTCRQLGIPFDASTSISIQRSLAQFGMETEEEKAKLQILTALCSKPMQNAKYFCTGVLDDEEDYRHYALNVPFYTHFTSPIRRYPDVMVHRLLAASLSYCSPPRALKAEVQKECELCNDKKTNAKRAGELSGEMFFAVFVKECGPLEEKAMVMGVLDKAFDVLVLKLGVIKRVYCEKLALKSHSYRKDKKNPILTLMWKADDDHPNTVRQTITMFTMVNCRLTADDQPLKWTAVIKHPSDDS